MITLNKAKKALEAAESKARELGIAVSVVIVDTQGTIIASVRMDGALPISPKFAYVKAYTSASLGLPSAALADYAKEGKPYFGITAIHGGELTPIAGGMPVKINEKVVGGVGVGGSMDVTQDAMCAESAAKELQV